MLRLLVFIFKAGCFAVLILVLGQVIRWDGKTVSDQVKTRMSSVERSPALRGAWGWAEELIDDFRGGSKKKPSTRSSASEPNKEEGTEFTPSERQKLRALIQELNHSAARKPGS